MFWLQSNILADVKVFELFSKKVFKESKAVRVVVVVVVCRWGGWGGGGHISFLLSVCPWGIPYTLSSSKTCKKKCFGWQHLISQNSCWEAVFWHMSSDLGEAFKEHAFRWIIQWNVNRCRAWWRSVNREVISCMLIIWMGHPEEISGFGKYTFWWKTLTGEHAAFINGFLQTLFSLLIGQATKE